jgi:hypothetical protein
MKFTDNPPFCIVVRRVPDPAQRPFGGARHGLDKNRENNPMQSKRGPRLAARLLRSVRAEEKGPNLISSRSDLVK